MKLIGDLKKQVESTNTKEEAMETLEKAGIELTDEELDQVRGGLRIVTTKSHRFSTLLDKIKKLFS